MITWHIDLGQLIIGILIGVVGFFVKLELNNFNFRLNRHDSILQTLISDTQRLIGIVDSRRYIRKEVNYHEEDYK